MRICCVKSFILLKIVPFAIRGFSGTWKNTRNCDVQKFIIDGTPDTVMFPERVYSTYKTKAPELLTDLKIIVTLREPTPRELSWYNHMVDMASEYKKNGTTKIPNWIRTVLGVEKESTPIMNVDEYTHHLAHGKLHEKIRQDSFYAKHLTKWFELFDRHQILILSYDELKADPYKVQNGMSAKFWA